MCLDLEAKSDVIRPLSFHFSDRLPPHAGKMSPQPPGVPPPSWKGAGQSPGTYSDWSGLGYLPMPACWLLGNYMICGQRKMLNAKQHWMSLPFLKHLDHFKFLTIHSGKINIHVPKSCCVIIKILFLK